MLFGRGVFSLPFGKDSDDQQLKRVIDHRRENQNSGEFRVGQKNRRHDRSVDERLLRAAVEGGDPVFPIEGEKARRQGDDSAAADEAAVKENETADLSEN